jgi:outer membrane protein OmpA-like peptidoglycan-associated protein/Mg-chelatase subunit ChlD
METGSLNPFQNQIGGFVQMMASIKKKLFRDGIELHLRFYKIVLECILLLFVISTSDRLFSQVSPLAISEDAKFIAFYSKPSWINDQVLVAEGMNYKKSNIGLYDMPVYIYNNKTGKFIHTLHLKTKEIPDLRNGAFSPNANTFFVRNGRFFTLWNIPSGKCLKTIKADTIIFSWQYDSFYALEGNQIIKYSFYYNQTDTFRMSKNAGILKFGLTTDDKFLIAQGTDQKVNIWRREVGNFELKTIPGYDFATDKNANFHVTTFKNEIFSLRTYNALDNHADFEKQKSLSADKFFGKKKSKKCKVILGSSLFSKGGEIFVLAWHKGKKKFWSFINISKRKENFKLEQSKNSYTDISPWFYSDTICFIRKDANTIEIYNVFTGKLLSSLKTNIPTCSGQILFDKRPLLLTRKETGLLVTGSTGKPEQTIATKSLNFCRNGNQNFIFQDQSERLAWRPVYTFFEDSTIHYFEENHEDLNNKYREEFVESHTDTISYIKIKELVAIGNAGDTKLNMQAKAMEITHEYTGFQFYLMDKDLKYYYGASAKDWNKIFCKLTVENEMHEIWTIDDFRIYESDDRKSPPLAICFVLDHSGSMAVGDVNAMQQSLISLSETKSSKDAFSLIKFDTKVQREVPFSTSGPELKEKIKVEGLKGYGGGTALIDGINDGLEMLKENTMFNNKALIVLTDGYENSSKNSANTVFKKAIDNNIAVFTIGLGASVDIEFLRSIANGTNGGYYWINQKNSLNDVFADIYRNMKNYYTIRFNTPYPGKYKLTLHLCPKGASDSLTHYFRNYVPDLLYTNDQNEKDSLFKKITGMGDTLYLNDFTAERVVEDMEFKEIKEEFDKLVFPKIKFDYDMTSIVKGTDFELKGVIDFLKRYPRCRLEVQGHTDNKGDLVYNEQLSQARADKVKSVMTEAGIEPERLRTRGFGETKPVDKNDTEQGRQKNRRVEFVLLSL